MLAVPGVLERLEGREPAPAEAEVVSASAETRGSTLDAETRQRLRTLLEPQKRDFSGFLLPERADLAPDAPRVASALGRPSEFSPLLTPVMTSGSRQAAEAVEPWLRNSGLRPVAAGGSIGSASQDAPSRLRPGGPLAVALASGDIQYTAIGTVTDVAEGLMLGFGHGMFRSGTVELPMGPGYVHTIVASRMNSFKLGSGLAMTGTLNRDESTAVAGIPGEPARTVPMRVKVRWPGRGGEAHYDVQLSRLDWLTPAVSTWVLLDAVLGQRDLPPEHTLDYRVSVDFGPLGRYVSANRISGMSVYPPLSDLSRTISAMLWNPFGEPVYPRGIEVEVAVEPADRSAQMIRLDLDSPVVRPGGTLRGRVTLDRWQKPRISAKVALEIPEDLPEGEYVLRALDFGDAAQELFVSRPQLFDIRSPEQLLEALRTIADFPAGRIYLRVDRQRPGVALDRNELPGLPASRTRLLESARPLDTFLYQRPLSGSTAVPYCVFGGDAGELSRGFTVKRRPQQVPVQDAAR
jgi:hypothetical protein